MPQRRELRTWPQIAAHLGMSSRGVQNYEKNAGLLVHRLVGQSKSRVWAYTDELDAWHNRTQANQLYGSAEVAPLNAPYPLPTTLGAKPAAFDGHHWYAVLVSAFYALLYAEAVLLETAYRFDTYGEKALVAAPMVFCWVFTTSLLALASDGWRTSQAKPGGQAFFVAIAYGSAALVQIAVSATLPAYSTMQKGREPWSGQTAYLKNVVLYFLPLATVYVLLPYHFILAVQREVRNNQRAAVLALLTGERKAAAPKGAVYVRAWWLAAGLFAAALLSVGLTQDLFDHLRPSLFKSLFMQLVLGRVLLYFATGLFCILWYSRALNEIKRECLAGVAPNALSATAN
jgi:hypothetical protein